MKHLSQDLLLRRRLQLPSQHQSQKKLLRLMLLLIQQLKRQLIPQHLNKRQVMLPLLNLMQQLRKCFLEKN